MDRRSFLRAVGAVLVTASLYLPRFGAEPLELDEERLMGLVYVSDELLRDSTVDMERLIAESFALEYA